MTGLNRGPWTDRTEAGRELGRAVKDALGGPAGSVDWPGSDAALVLGLPRGGVVVAAAVADTVGGELDVLVVRKAGVPWHRELAIGAVTASGVRIINDDVVSRARLSARDVEAAFVNARREAEERERLFRSQRPPLSVGGRTVVIVDDGIATGATALAAAQLLRSASPAPGRVLLAAPVAPPETVERLAAYVDDMVVLNQPSSFMAVGEWFTDFTQVDDSQVSAIIAERDPW